MKKILVYILIFGLGITAGWLLFSNGILDKSGLISPIGQTKEVPTPLYEYSFEKLREKKFTPKKIELVEKMSKSEEFESWLFKFETDEGEVSGQVNFPAQFEIRSFDQAQDLRNLKFEIGSQLQKYPIIIMLRGYVEKEEYATGVGTKNAAAYFARNGFITLAPDFLGYGQSDPPQTTYAGGQVPESMNDLAERFVRPATIMQLIASVGDQKIGLWGHSNGGQIALSVLEITDKVMPTTLWAPVSKPFPYSVLYYTGESEDSGKYLIGLIADFMRIYDAQKFSLTNYFSVIKSPIQLHQGTADESVPKRWSDDLAKNLKKEGIKVNYFTYSGADHNLKPASLAGGPGWDTVVKRDVEFFKKEL